MVGVVFVVLVFGALVAAIWGRETVQGCFRNAGLIVFWGVAGVAMVAIPPLGIGAALLLAIYLLFRFGRAYGKAVEETRMEEEWAEQEKERCLQHKLVSAANALDQNGRPTGALIRAQYCKPRPNAPTALPNAAADAEYWATPVREPDRSGYDVEERKSGCRVFLTVSEFGRDWVPCRAPLKTSPQPVEEPPKPRWSPPRKESRRS